MNALERVWQRSAWDGDCLVYEAPIRKSRPWEHPQVNYGGRKRGVHTVAYEAVNGPQPEGSVLRHTCDRRGCVNVDHLIPGTRAENVADMVARGRVARLDRHSQAKLTTETAQAIRVAVAQGETITSAARRYGVCRSTASHVVSGHTWKNINTQLTTTGSEANA